MRKLKRIAAGFGILLGAALACAQPAMAGEADASLQLSGFVDGSFVAEDKADSTFSLDQVELDIKKTINEHLALRADLNYLESSSALTFADVVEQGFVSYRLDAGNGVLLTAGKFNAPIGFELLDPVDMYQFSHSLVFDYGLPTNLTGFMGSYVFNDMFDASVYVVNGWDNNADNNGGKTVGGRVGITPVKGVNIGLSAITGSVEAPLAAQTNDDKRTVYDVDVTVTVIDDLIVGAEFNVGDEDKASAVVAGEDAQWTAYLVMAHYDINERFGVTARYDYFNDEDGARLGNSVRERQKSYTISPSVELGEGALLLAEYRHYTSSSAVYGGEDSKDSVAVEFTYSF